MAHARDQLGEVGICPAAGSDSTPPVSMMSRTTAQMPTKSSIVNLFAQHAPELPDIPERALSMRSRLNSVAVLLGVREYGFSAATPCNGRISGRCHKTITFATVA
jgi:hypothetical protein